jgi:cytochrome c553
VGVALGEIGKDQEQSSCGTSRRLPGECLHDADAEAPSPDDIADVAAYYAGVNGLFLPLLRADPMLIRRSEQLTTIGDAAKNFRSCDNCHGPGGAGDFPAIPCFAGQYAHDTAFELQIWRRGFRKNSPEAMAEIARHLGDQDNPS